MDEEKRMDETYPSKDYHKKVFSLSTEEKKQLEPFEQVTRFAVTINTLAAIAQSTKNNFVVETVLARLAVKKSTDSAFTYDLTKNQVIVYEPRLWCSSCDIKKAEYQYKDKIYCSACIDVVKESLAKKIEDNTVKVEEKPTEVANVQPEVVKKKPVTKKN